MADVTLRQGIEAMLQQHVPEVKGIVDITDHTAGSNPTSPPRKSKGAACCAPTRPGCCCCCRPSRIARCVRRNGPRLGVDVTVASERPSTFERANPPASSPWISPTRRTRPRRRGVRVRASLHASWRWTTTPPWSPLPSHRTRAARQLRRAAAAARDKHQQRQLLAAAGVAVPRFELRTIARTRSGWRTAPTTHAC